MVDLDARIKVDCINLRPDVISIMIGVNDVWHELATTTAWTPPSSAGLPGCIRDHPGPAQG